MAGSMSFRLSPIHEARNVTLDQRDWDSVRDRLLQLEEEQRRIAHEMALFQEGVKERLNVFNLLLSKLEAAMARKDLE
jgi:hypothetical protein